MSCITLLTDFGHDDASVAVAKGILLQRAIGLPIVDISHVSQAFQVRQCAYLLAQAYPNFPLGTFHIAICDVFAQRDSSLILCKKDGQYFFAADDYLLSYALQGQYDAAYTLANIKPSYHVRDLIHIIADTIKALQQSSIEALSLQPTSLKTPPQQWFPTVEGNELHCQVLHIDIFGNVVLNVTFNNFEKVRAERRFRIAFMRNETLTEISNHYNVVAELHKLCRFNSAGYLELCINRGSAANVFGFELRHDKHMIYKTVKIIFE